MITTNDINSILEIKESYKAPDKLLEIMFNKEKREKIFFDFMNLFNHDVSFEWFHQYFEDEHADRKKHKQDFTPHELADLLAKLTSIEKESNIIHDTCCGTGTITIKKWWNILLNKGIGDYYPNNYLFICEELSDRAIPFLLFNLCIRGMNAVVIHGDVLTRECYGVFLIQNIDNDFLHFSNLNVMPYTTDVENYFNVKFIEKRYENHVENPKMSGGENDAD